MKGSVVVQKAKRLEGLTSAVFADMEQKKDLVAARGVGIINLGIGSPDMAPALHVIERLQKEIADQGNYGYAITGLPELLEAIAHWYANRFGVELDPQTEVVDLIGSQEGLAHISLAVINPGDVVLVPDPGYPIYSAGPLFAGAKLYYLPLLESNNYLPDLDAIPAEIRRKAKMIVLNYPNNPLTATADLDFFQRLVEFAHENQILICHDAAYSELAFDGYTPPSILQVPGAREVAVEFHSCSKTFSMAGCRVGFMSGHADVVSWLKTVKSYTDYGIFKPIQYAAIAALTGPQTYVQETARRYQRRRDVLIDGLRSIGWQIEKPKATMFVWAPVPAGYSSQEFAIELLEKTGVVVLPGIGFGPAGEGYVRIGLVQPEDALQEAVDRLEKSGIFVRPATA